jgi:hypothetical protein
MAGGGYGNGEKRQQRKISAESGQRVRFGHGFQRLLRIDNNIAVLVFIRFYSSNPCPHLCITKTYISPKVPGEANLPSTSNPLQQA